LQHWDTNVSLISKDFKATLSVLTLQSRGNI